METAILVIVLLGGCLAMHWFMMRGHKHSDESHKAVGTDKDKDSHKHSGHGCCH